MSLVAYGTTGSSDESEDDCEAITTSTTEPQGRNYLETSSAQTIHRISASAIDMDDVYDPIDPHLPSSSIFGKLPEPKHHIPALQIISESEVVHPISSSKSLFASLPSPKNSCNPMDVAGAHVKKTVKILAPPLLPTVETFDDELPKKKSKPSSKGSGLFSLLPAPRNATVKETNRSLVPHVLTKKTAAIPIRVNKPPQKVQKPMSESLKLISYADSGDDSDEGSGTQQDFFSLQSETTLDHELPFVPLHEDIPYSSPSEVLEPEEKIPNNQPLAFVSGFQPSPWSSTSGPSQPGPSWQSNEDQSESQGASVDEDYLSVVEDDLQLDDEALERLCGRRAKKQKHPVEVIDVSGAEIMPDPKEWLIKQLSQEQPKRRSHSHKKNDGPTSQQRRKHQITYLAFQAKENELELKNQWSQNRMSRKQTQSKYGF